jgi:RNA polymerase sigma-70 factor (ECF subfamily)
MGQAVIDRELIAAAQAGDEPAIEALLAAALPIIEGRVCHIMGHDSDAADAIQDSLIKVWKKLDTYSDGNFTGWLLRIATNTCYDLLRSRRRHPVSCWEHMEIVDDGDLFVVAQRCEYLQRLRWAMETLDDNYAKALQLVDLDGREYTEAASVLGVPLGTVKSRVHRGRQALATMLRE